MAAAAAADATDAYFQLLIFLKSFQSNFNGKNEHKKNKIK